MNLEQLKQEFSNDYQERCEKQEITIKKLNYRIAEQKKFLAEFQTTIGQLQNRCYVMSQGTFCPMCGFKDTCTARREHIKIASKL